MSVQDMIGWEIACVVGLAVLAAVLLVMAWRASGPRR
jgi:hypothetical protein